MGKKKVVVGMSCGVDNYVKPLIIKKKGNNNNATKVQYYVYFCTFVVQRIIKDCSIVI